MLFAVSCLGCNFDTNTTTNDYDDSELRTRISELERILAEKENQESNTSDRNEETINEENVPENEDNFKIIADDDYYFNIIDQNGDILYYFSKLNGDRGYCTKREHEIMVTTSTLDSNCNWVYNHSSIYYKNVYGNKYIVDERTNHLFCLRHNKSYSYSSSYISAPSSSTDICELPDNWGSFSLESNWAKTPEEFLKNAGLRNQNYLINYILNFIESEE